MLTSSAGVGSIVRTDVLGHREDPHSTGDLAYRATIPIDKIKALNDPQMERFLDLRETYGWWQVYLVNARSDSDDFVGDQVRTCFYIPSEMVQSSIWLSCKSSELASL